LGSGLSKENLTLKQVKYEFRQFGVSNQVTNELLYYTDGPKIVAHTLLNGITNFVMSWDMATRKMKRYKWPANWKQAVKERFAPKWVKRRWPVVYTVLDIGEIAAVRMPDGVKFQRFYYMEQNPYDE
jgi:hypothetical protein